tara:strand:- start:1022 stop:1150 length:129 start_codon:yes stop_codon:yes gene_type:complete
MDGKARLRYVGVEEKEKRRRSLCSQVENGIHYICKNKPMELI